MIRTKPPLPFQGNKSKGKKYFMEVLHEIEHGENKIFVDLFGGSFYLSYLVHCVYPEATIICNDFDNYLERLLHIPDTNILLSQIREICSVPKDKPIPKDIKAKIDEKIKTFSGFKDIITLSVNLIFSSRYFVELEPFLKYDYYNTMNKKGYDPSINDYIEGLTFVHCDWRELYQEYKDKKDVVFIADPPYLGTDLGGYVSSRSWQMKDALEVLDLLKQESFILYTSNKPGIIDVINYIQAQGVEIKPYKTKGYERGVCTKNNVGNKNGEFILYYV